MRTGQAKARWDTGFVDRKLQLTVIRQDSLQFRAMNPAAATKVREVMRMAVPMTVAVAGGSAQFAPGRDRNPTAEDDERDTCRSINHVAEAGRNRDPGKPNHRRDQQR